MRHAGDWEPALDYLASGLRELPLNLEMLYNYACISEKLGRPELALKFFRHAREIRPRWTDALFGEAVTNFKLGDYKTSQERIALAIAHYKEDSSVDLGVMQYFQAMCYKRLGDYKKAKRDYGGLLARFRQSEGAGILNHVVASVLLPLNEDRRFQHEFMENTIKLLRFFQPCPPLESFARLDQPRCVVEGTNKLAANLFVAKMLKMRPFFGRFTEQVLLEFAPFGRVEYFDREDIIFLAGRVGVITHGSVRIMSHRENILQPTTIGRYKPGRILGHGETDGHITLHSQTWLVVFDRSTEIVFFPKDKFDQLWRLQCMDLHRTILGYILEKNRLWRLLSPQTQLELVHDGLEVRKYRPGELICRMSKSSPINERVFGRFYQSSTSKFKDELEKAKSKDQANQKIPPKDARAGGKQAHETVIQGFVRSLASVDPDGTKLMQAVSQELKESISTTLDYDQREGEARKVGLRQPRRGGPQPIGAQSNAGHTRPSIGGDDMIRGGQTLNTSAAGAEEDLAEEEEEEESEHAFIAAMKDFGSDALESQKRFADHLLKSLSPEEYGQGESAS